MDMVLDFLRMGGYGVYVWPAYAVTALFMVAMLWLSLGGLRRDRRTLEGLQATRPRRRRQAGDA